MKQLLPAKARKSLRNYLNKSHRIIRNRLNAEKLARYRAHVLSRIEENPVGESPFYHDFIENIFPDDLYKDLQDCMLYCKSRGITRARSQDNPDYANSRYPLIESYAEGPYYVREIFSELLVKQAILRKFYQTPSMELANSIAINSAEFEYVYTGQGRRLNIHIDVPPKYLSFIFYLPERPLEPREEEQNATILYDKLLKPCYRARYKANSVFVFAPHFYTYHGFSSTLPRNVMTMFYVNRGEFKAWKMWEKSGGDRTSCIEFLDRVDRKLSQHPLIEYGDSKERRLQERQACLVNAPKGRVLPDNPKSHSPRDLQKA